MPAPPAPTDLVLALAAGPQVNVAWSLNGIADATNVSVQRRDSTAGQSFAEVHSSAGNATSWAGDAGPFTAKHRYAYRVKIVGGASDGLVSNESAMFGDPCITRRLRRMQH